MNLIYPDVPLKPFLEKLIQEGFTITVETYGEIVIIMKYFIEHYKLPAEDRKNNLTAQLKLLIKPIVVKSPMEEETFNQVFDTFFLSNNESTNNKELVKDIRNKTALKTSVRNELLRSVLFWTIGICSFLILLISLLYFGFGEGNIKNFEKILLSIQNIFGLVVLISGIIVLLRFLKSRIPLQKLIKSKSILFQGDTSVAYFPKINLPRLDLISQAEKLDMLANMRNHFHSTYSTRTIDITKTIKETANSGGNIVPVFSKIYNKGSYLVLLDISIASSHLLPWFEYLFYSLSSQFISFNIWYFNGNLNTCWTYLRNGEINNKNLNQLDQNKRLIIISSGLGIIDPTRGNVFPWAKQIINLWQDRVLLTPYNKKSWSFQEHTISNFIPLFPANWDGLHSAIEYLNGKSAYRFNNLGNQSSPMGDNLASKISSLKKNYGIKFFNWIAACAVYPQLYWELTLSLGLALEDSQGNITNKDSIEKMLNLPWFRSGKMEIEDRKIFLSSISPEAHIKARKWLKEIFTLVEERSELPYQSLEWRQFKLYQQVNLAFLNYQDEPQKNIKNSIALLQGALKDRGEIVDEILAEQIKTVLGYSYRWKRFIKNARRLEKEFFAQIQTVSDIFTDYITRTVGNRIKQLNGELEIDGKKFIPKISDKGPTTLFEDENNFVFFFGLPGSGKSTLLASLNYYLRNNYQIIQNIKNPDGIRLINKHISALRKGSFPELTKPGKVTEYDLKVELDSKFALNITFLETSGEDLKQVKAEIEEAIPEVIIPFLSSKKTPISFVLVADYIRTTQRYLNDKINQDDLMSEFLDTLYVFGANTENVALIVTKYDRDKVPSENNLEKFIREFFPQTYLKLSNPKRFPNARVFPFSVGKVDEAKYKIDEINLNDSKKIISWLLGN